MKRKSVRGRRGGDVRTPELLARAEREFIAYLDSLPSYKGTFRRTVVKEHGLPGLRVLLIPLGGGERLDKVTFSYATASHGRNWRKGELFIGRGDVYLDAMLEAIRTFVEMTYYRSRQRI